ncbi:MAG: tetratricopeptide repeat protein, partial [Actinomycetes bacterium]|nr:tetratricopeptide repeat protein [Actinomycetes bacterium]
MNTAKFAEAQAAYKAGDYRRAARGFLEAIEKGTPVGNGPAYHMAGNSFMRLKRYSDAAVVFEHALRDDTYQRRAAVEANLANSYVKTGDYGAAVAHYEAALAALEGEDADNAGKNAWKYYQGMGLAFMRREEYKQAALAYKHAALGEHNPAPGKALTNLGMAMMADGQPEAAIEAYRAALVSAGAVDRGRALLNLGVAYHTRGKYREAIRAIEEAQMLHGHSLGVLGERTLADARARLDIEKQVAASDAELENIGVAGEDEVAGGGDGVVVAAVNNGAVNDTVVGVAGDEVVALDVEDEAARVASMNGQETGQIVTGAAVDEFFERDEREIARTARREAHQTHPFAWMKPVGIILIIVAVLAGGAYALYATGQGIPSPKTTVTDLLEAYNAGRDIAPMWLADAPDITRQMVAIPASNDFTIVSVTTGANVSSAEIHITTEEGAKLLFEFHLAREGIGWKVRSVESQVQ